MDINNLAMENESSFRLKDPMTGLESDGEITLYSVYSQEFTKAKKEVLKIKSLDEELYQIELLTRVTKEIKGFFDGKKPLESNDENIKKLYSSPYVREEADKFISDKSNFFLNK